MSTQKESRWTWFDRVFLVLPSVAVVAVVWLINASSEKARLRLEYVRIATGILQQQEPSDIQRGLREWAVAVLNKSAPVRLSEAQADSLVDGSSVLPKSVTFPYSNYDSYEIVPPAPRPSPSPQ